MPPQVGTADHHRPGAEGEGLDHIAPAADAAVQEHFDLVTDGAGHADLAIGVHGLDPGG
jgi:hypothetical protein